METIVASIRSLLAAEERAAPGAAPPPPSLSRDGALEPRGRRTGGYPPNRETGFGEGGARRGGAFDPRTEELLRSVIREWLDDNLPDIVERLVREEMDRVARGPR